MHDEHVDVVTDDDAPDITPSERNEFDETAAIAQASGAGLASRMQAGKRRLEQDRTKMFDIPGWPALDEHEEPIPGADHDMRVRMKKLTEPELDKAKTPLVSIALATDKVLFRETPRGEHRELTWREVGNLMGLEADVQQSLIVSAVFDHSAAAIRTFYLEVVTWMAGQQSAIERLLGE